MDDTDLEADQANKDRRTGDQEACVRRSSAPDRVGDTGKAVVDTVQRCLGLLEQGCEDRSVVDRDHAEKHEGDEGDNGTFKGQSEVHDLPPWGLGLRGYSRVNNIKIYVVNSLKHSDDVSARERSFSPFCGCCFAVNTVLYAR